MRTLGLYIILMCMFGGSALGQQAVAEKPGSLADGKLMYVGAMPENVDAWIVEDLRLWGKYKPTREAEGADLVMKAVKPETRTEYKLERGIPTPKKSENKKGNKPILFSISVADWVTGQVLWSADIINRKPKSGGAEAKHGPDVEIDARGFSSEQIATAIVRELRAYVGQMAPDQDSQPPPLSH